MRDGPRGMRPSPVALTDDARTEVRCALSALWSAAFLRWDWAAGSRELGGSAALPEDYVVLKALRSRYSSIATACGVDFAEIETNNLLAEWMHTNWDDAVQWSVDTLNKHGIDAELLWPYPPEDPSD